jgi:hypothetical protein
MFRSVGQQPSLQHQKDRSAHAPATLHARLRAEGGYREHECLPSRLGLIKGAGRAVHNYQPAILPQFKPRGGFILGPSMKTS